MKIEFSYCVKMSELKLLPNMDDYFDYSFILNIQICISEFQKVNKQH